MQTYETKKMRGRIIKNENKIKDKNGWEKKHIFVPLRQLRIATITTNRPNDITIKKTFPELWHAVRAVPLFRHWTCYLFELGSSVKAKRLAQN